MGEHLVDFVERAGFDFDFEVEAVGFLIGRTTVEGLGDAAGKVHVVVFEQNHVEEADAVVGAAADFDGFFFEHTHAGCGFAGIEHTCVCAFESFDIGGRHRGNAAHALHHVEHKTLGLQQASDFAGDNHGHVAGFHVCAVVNESFHFEGGVKAVEDFVSNSHAGQDAFFFDEQFRLAHGIFGDAAERGVVAVADVFREGKVDEPVVQFVNGIHIEVFMVFGEYCLID